MMSKMGKRFSINTVIACINFCFYFSIFWDTLLTPVGFFMCVICGNNCENEVKM